VSAASTLPSSLLAPPAGCSWPPRSEELDRPENRDLKPLVGRLRDAKEAIDARRQEGQAPLSWADTIVLAAKVGTLQAHHPVKQRWRCLAAPAREPAYPRHCQQPCCPEEASWTRPSIS
jgi:hypothetical protein